MTTDGAAPVRPRHASLRALGPLICATALASLLLGYLSSGPERNFEDAALSEGTSSYFARYEQWPIHCRDMRDAKECLSGVRSRNKGHAALWFGNSQLHAVNQMEVGQEPAPPLLFRKLLPRDIDLLTFSQPNATMLEHYVLFEFLRHQNAFQAVILPVVFDDFRDQGVRATLRDALGDASTRDALKQTDLGRRVLANYAAVGGDLAGLRNTIQYHVEQRLTGWLEQNSTLWERRKQARGKLFLSLFRLRNSLFGITPQSKRLRLKGPYQLNMEALETILAVARQHGVRVLAYIVPLRNDVEMPYRKAEYAQFKEDVRKRARAHGAELADLETLVPAEYWGAKQATTVGAATELDFMHFQAPGHVLLANEIERLLIERGLIGAAP